MFKKVYLAGGMEYAPDGKSWRDQAVEVLKQHNIRAWEPYKEEAKIFKGKEAPVNMIKKLDKHDDFESLHIIMRRIVRLDLEVVSTEIDAVLVKYDPSVLRGAGTHAEISVATFLGVPVHAWLDNLTLREVPTWAIGCFDTVSYTFSDAIQNITRCLNEAA